MRISATNETYAADLPFKDAAAFVCKAWRKQHGYRVPPPPISHALSIYEDGAWIVLDSELGEVVARVENGAVTLVEAS